MRSVEILPDGRFKTTVKLIRDPYEACLYRENVPVRTKDIAMLNEMLCYARKKEKEKLKELFGK
jgi:hypothetical protein